jgi:hypothetical protein
MSLAYNTLYAIPRLSCYADADKWEKNTKPIRGDAENTKPLGKRNQKYRSIRREPDGSITIRSNSSIPMRFMPDNTLYIRDIGYSNKASENEIITEVTGMRVHTDSGRAWIRYDGGTAPLRQAPKSKYVQGKGWVHPEVDSEPWSVFKKNDRGNWVCTNPPSLTTHTVNRKVAKELRARYQTGITYANTLDRLREHEMPTQKEYYEVFADRVLSDDTIHWWNIRRQLGTPGDREFNHTQAAELAGLLLSEDPGDQYKAYLWLRLNWHNMIIQSAERVLMMHHHAEWFNEKQVPVGEKAIDRYLWAFPQNEA